MAEFSDQPVDGIQQGTVLTHNDRGFAGIFERSRVLLTVRDIHITPIVLYTSIMCVYIYLSLYI